jgi:hypothetical protein
MLYRVLNTQKDGRALGSHLILCSLQSLLLGLRGKEGKQVGEGSTRAWAPTATSYGHGEGGQGSIGGCYPGGRRGRKSRAVKERETTCLVSPQEE